MVLYQSSRFPGAFRRGDPKWLSWKRLQQRRLLSLSSSDDMTELRNNLRQYGSKNDYVSLQLTRDLAQDNVLSRLKSCAAIVTLHNPSSRNALTGKMMAEMADVVDELQLQTSCLSIVVLRGSDDFFCAGADLGIAQEHLLTREGGRTMSAVMMDTCTRIQQLPFITLSAIQGMAVGGGAELCTATDYRIVDSRAKIQFVHAKMGLVPGWGGGMRLVNLVGKQTALYLLGTAKPCTAQECLEMGIADKIVQDKAENAMDNDIVDFLESFQCENAHVLHAAKNVVSNASGESSLFYKESMAREQEIFLSLWGGEANLEAIKKRSSPKTKESKKQP